MKVCLLNPPVNFDISLGKLKAIGSFNIQIPLGVAYLAGFLKKHNIQVEIIDAYAEQLSVDKILDKLLAKNIDLLGITCLTPTFPIACDISERFKKLKPEAIVVLGGEHVSLFPEEALQNDYIDIVVRGEGELTLLELIKKLEVGNNVSFATIQGISYKNNDRIINNPDRAPIDDLDRIPFPAYKLLPMHLYTSPPQWLISHPSYQIIASRGCPYRCSFCSLKVMGKKRRVRSPQNVIEEMSILLENYNTKQILFSDPIFPISKQEGIKFCKAILNSGLNKFIRWATETRVDIVDEQLLNWMYKSGCRIVGYGIESGDQNVLDSIGKGFNLQQAYRAVKLTRKAGIKVYSSFILGLPEETPLTIRKTIQFAKRLNSDFVQFNLAVPYPGTKFFKQAMKEKKINKRITWAEYLNSSGIKNSLPVYHPDKIDGYTLRKLQKAAYRQYYLRPHFILKSLFGYNSIFLIKRKIKTAYSLFCSILN